MWAAQVYCDSASRDVATYAAWARDGLRPVGRDRCPIATPPSAWSSIYRWRTTASAIETWASSRRSRRMTCRSKSWVLKTSATRMVRGSGRRSFTMDASLRATGLCHTEGLHQGPPRRKASATRCARSQGGSARHRPGVIKSGPGLLESHHRTGSTPAWIRGGSGQEIRGDDNG